jgi:hypothetical protein
MISPDKIKDQALKWWKLLLQSTIAGEAFFPKSIDRIGKVQPGHITQRFETLQQEIELLYQHSKNQTGSGYLVKRREQNFLRTGTHELPDSIVFETIEDYIAFTGKKKEWSLFLSNYDKIKASIPQLTEWVLQHCLRLTESHINWRDILKVCRYFIDNPRPELYLRQLPIPIHTKFIEENTSLLQLLLDFLIPNHIRNAGEKRFSERYFLQFDEPLIRVRFLDASLTPFGNFFDISIPLSDFEKFDLPAKNVLIAENKMNFLTLPAATSAIAIWSGGGFNISYLKNAVWLTEKNIFYWGDIDEHGFQILHQLRSYYPHVKSIMMDCKTFEHFAAFATVGARNKSENLSLLNDQERQLFNQLKSIEKNRLEQEKISQVYVNEYLNFRTPISLI